MKRHPIVRAARASRGYVASRRAYVFFCASIVFTVALLMLATFFLPPRPMPMAELRAVELPVAMIQFVPDRAGQCRHLVFHNDTGRFEEGGTGQCRSLIADALLVDTIRSNRTEALGKVFKLR